MISLDIQVEMGSKCIFFLQGRKEKAVSYNSLLDERQNQLWKNFPGQGRT